MTALHEIRLNTFTPFGEFSDNETENTFQADKWTETRKKMRYACAISALAYLGAGYIDYAILGGGFKLGLMVGARFIVFLLGFGAMLFTIPNTGDARRLGWALGLYMLSILLCESLELILKAGISGIEGVHPAVVILLTFYFILPPKTLPTLLACAIGSISFISTTALLPSIPIDQFWNTMLFFVVVNGFGYISLTRVGLALRRESQAKEHLKKLAEIDTLTQVFNRRKVLQAGEHLLKEATRYNNPISILLLDIDHFKASNDKYGHISGDLALQQLAQRCMDQLREVDVFGRIGGEEFLAFLPHTNLQQAAHIAERLREYIARTPMTVADHKNIQITVSIGVAEFTPDTPAMDLLMHRADISLYEAKKSGRNMVFAEAR